MSWSHTKTSVVFKQLTILALNTFYLYPTGIFLTCHYLLPSNVQHLPSAKPKKLCTLLLNLNLPAGHFTKCPGFCPQEGQNPQTSSILFIPNEQLSRQGKSFELFILFFQRHQTKSETGAKPKPKR